MSPLSDALGRLFSSDGFVPRRVCGLWPDWLVWEHVAGNALVWLAYVAMPVLIWRLGHRRPDWSPFAGLIRSFAGFIVLCGLGHFLDMLAFFRPMYRLSGHVLVATGVVSWWTAWSLRRAWPTLVAMKGPAELERVTAERTDELARANAELRDSEAKLRAIVEAAVDGIITIDERGAIEALNPAALRIFGYDAGELLGRNVKVLMPEPYHSEHDGYLSNYRDSGRRKIIGIGREVVGRRKDGNTFPVDLAVSEVPLGRRRIFTGTVRDITGRVRAEQELRAAKEAADAASRTKDQFLAVLSHELRTPLTPVLAAVTALLDEPGEPAEVRPTLELIRRSVELEARLIDDLLDVNRIARGKLHLNREVVDAHDLLHQTLGICRSDLHGKRMRLDLGLDAVRHHVEADPARLQQVFWNLIKNAVKFTDAGGSVSVRTRDEEGPGPHGRLVIEVSDTGLGIAPEVLPRIFNAFEQGEDTVTRRFGGLGLGLALSRSVAEAHGGRLRADSPGRGRGATFTLELEAAEAPARPAPATPPPGPPAPPAGQPLRILLVEDDRPTLGVITRLLRRRGYEVTAAETVAAALEAGGRGGFDLVVSDIGLPDGTGWDLMRRLRQHHGVPGIALTGFGMDEDLSRTREAGFVAHLTKPVDFARLEAAIRQVGAEGT